MRLIVDLSPGDPALGLATDEALLEAVRGGDAPVIRVWVNDRAAVVGRSQSLAEEVDLARAREEGIPALRRISGGGTVYHYSGNLNVSVIFADGRRFGTLEETFRRVGTAIADGLTRLRARLDVRGSGLFVGEAKVGGAAQARRGSACLYHSTLLVQPTALPMDGVLLALRSGYSPTRVPSRPHRTTTLTQVTGRWVALSEAARAIVDGLSELVPDGTVDEEMAESVQAAARALADSKYRDPAWNALR